MQEDTKNVMKEVLVRFNQTSQRVKEKLNITPFRTSLIKMYLKAPHKIQYALAKFGLRLMAKRKAEQQEFLRH